MRIHIRLWDNPDKAAYSRITPKTEATLTQSLGGAWAWMWHETILNQIQFCVLCNWRRENYRRRPKHLMELAGNSVRVNVRQSRTEQPQRAPPLQSLLPRLAEISIPTSFHKCPGQDAIFLTVQFWCQQIASARDVAKMKHNMPISINELVNTLDYPQRP
jgi:hypothetical protein